jgi:hypothetical protein
METTKQLQRFWGVRRVTAEGRVYILRKRRQCPPGLNGHSAHEATEKEVPR